MYLIQNKNHENDYKIVKIFEEQGNDHYIREKNILQDLLNNDNPTDNDYIIKLKTDEIILDFNGQFPHN